MVEAVDTERVEALGPAERIVQALTSFTDHMVHNRPGVVSPDARTRIGCRWQWAIWKEEEDGQKVVYAKSKSGKRISLNRLGVLGEDGIVRDGARVVGEYRKPGIYPEVAAYLYRQVADVWKMDNEFAARWASWSFAKDHRDLKVVLAAFMLAQSRCGEPVKEDGEILFFDENYRDVGEAMCLIRAKDDINPKMLMRVGDVLRCPGVAQINREMGFGRSARNPPALGRYNKVVARWLRHREQNSRMLVGLVKAGYKSTVKDLCRRVGYKPDSATFFETLGWKQKQAKDGRRTILDVNVAEAESWADLSEEEICLRIVQDKPNYKRIVALVPASIGITRAIMAAAIEAGSVSDSDLIILTPTLEDLGLLQVPAIRDRWQRATEAAENARAATIASRVRSKDVAEKLEDAADGAMARAVEEATRDLRVYVIVDKSGSMEGALDTAKSILAKFLGAFPLERTHVAVFNTMGTEIKVKAPKRAAVEHAFRGHQAGGGTYYASGVAALAHHKPAEHEDALMLFVGDQGDRTVARLVDAVQESGINPVAFAMLHVAGRFGDGTIVYDAARRLEIPCVPVEKELFDDPYAATRTLPNLIASTPVQAGPRRQVRRTLVEEILRTPLLDKPVWASPTAKAA